VRGSEPDMASVACLIGPDRNGVADDEARFESLEIAPVKAVADVEVHQKYFALVQCMTASPRLQRTAVAVEFACKADRLAVNRDAFAEAANSLTHGRSYEFEERYTARQIAPLCECFSKPGRKIGCDEVAAMILLRGPDGLVTVWFRSPISLCYLPFERQRADTAEI
jgi:hypothetical protein